MASFSTAFIYSLIFWITWHSANGSSLPPSEVAALRKIAKSLQKSEWNFSANPCAGDFGWSTNQKTDTVSCNCTETICHVTKIVLMNQNLRGFLPPELTELPFIQDIVLSRNYLSGSIPPQWGSTKLLNITLFGNRLNGSIPKEIGNISTLLHLALDMNMLSGPLPPELGSLTSLQKLHLTSNNFTGEIPATFAELTSLEEFRLADNLLSGKVPDFIQKWIHLKNLRLQGSGLAGPIPPGISLLVNLTDLRITDLNGTGTEEPFPKLEHMKLITLILRSCNIVGELPSYLGNMTTLKTLDLSFNKLSGPIPDSYSGLFKTIYMYFTFNSLNGTVPAWTLKSENVDLSYNNFALSNTTSACKLGKPNIFGNPLVMGTVGSSICSRDICPTTYRSFSINCGGDALNNGSLTFDADTLSAKAAEFYVSPTNWAWSSTGHVLDDNIPKDKSTVQDHSRGTSGLDKDARVSPILLTYYGFCLVNGMYNIDLYFSEIEFSNDRTYGSLGRRVFDIYIQGILVQKDFNIAAEAGGARMRVVKQFSSRVTNRTLEIRLRWAGKGTTALPDPGMYGPIISAISVTNSDATLSTDNGLSTAAKIGIPVSVVSVLFSLAAVLWWKREFFLEKIRNKDELGAVELQTGSYTLRQLQVATNNFDPANKIGEGGFGPVFKGHLADGTTIAVKQLSAKSHQGSREFVNEIGTISALQHPNLVKLHGCCIEGNQLSLIYEYMVNNNLSRALFAKSEQGKLHLDWPARYRICTGIARGLAYLHEESPLKIVHRDIKATNILLDADMTPKISDFGLAKLDDEVDTHIHTRIAGTVGYIAPEYAMRGYLTDKADIYSFGVLALEIVSGKSNTTLTDGSNLLDWTRILEQKGQLMDLVDPRLEGKIKKKEVMKVIQVGLQCTKFSPSERPKMSLVVGILEGKYGIDRLQIDPTNIASSSSGP